MVEMPKVNRDVVGQVNLSSADEPASRPTSETDTHEGLSVQKASLGIGAFVLMAIFLFIIVQGVFQTGV